MLLTYAQGWGKGHGCMQGSHGDELGLLGLLRVAHRERWWLCPGSWRNLGTPTLRGQTRSPVEDLSTSATCSGPLDRFSEA